MNDALTQLTYEALNALTFDDLPAATETAGKGIHLGKHFRTIETTASDRQGAEHRYRLTITRYDAPAQQALKKWEAAEKHLRTLQNQDTDRVKCFRSYQERLSKAFDNAEKLHSVWRAAEREQALAAPDKVNLKDLGRTEAQIKRDSESLMATVLRRPSAAFLNYLLEGSDVTANGSQRELIADFLEGQNTKEPFYFMGHKWIPVLEKAGAIMPLPSGELQISGENLKQAYHTFWADLVRKAS